MSCNWYTSSDNYYSIICWSSSAKYNNDMYMIASTYMSDPLDITLGPSRAANTTVTPNILLGGEKALRAKDFSCVQLISSFGPFFFENSLCISYFYVRTLDSYYLKQAQAGFISGQLQPFLITTMETKPVSYTKLCLYLNIELLNHK